MTASDGFAEVEAMTSIAEALAYLDSAARKRVLRWANEALTDAPTREPTGTSGRKGGTTGPLLDLLADGTEHTQADLEKALASQDYRRSSTAVTQALSRLTLEGRIVRVAQGTYRIKEES